jgi:hypothetical protein
MDYETAQKKGLQRGHRIDVQFNKPMVGRAHSDVYDVTFQCLDENYFRYLERGRKVGVPLREIKGVEKKVQGNTP